MKRVAVLGGGPAGAFAAERLAAGGLETVLLDSRLAWEKPCGGGVTYKAYDRYPFLLENDVPKRLVTETLLSSPRVGTARLSLRQPLVIYSRYDLNRLLLERAERAGARIERTWVQQATYDGQRWRLETRGGVLETDFCIAATGARNPLRNLGTQWTPSDTMLALGYFVPAQQSHIDICFLPPLEGYIWVFPRCGHLSVGICGKGVPAPLLRARLEAFMRERGISWRGAEFYAHVLPSLETPAWRNNRVAGHGWLAVGDAGGLVDPVTGEGLYYALRSADLASQVVLSNAQATADKPRAYRAWLMRDFILDLALGAGLAKRLFLGKLLFQSVPERMIQLMRRSERFSFLMQDLFAGTQNYLTLKSRLLRNLHGTLLETVVNFLLRRMVPEEIPL
ncbi:MAG: NAD(P)/FAD-dependent oxidoreductase [Acidobacteria bacterium]|nr:NAD(P)/FAD-dependent oxidoreductase [Acidobacteriota bacterium]